MLALLGLQPVGVGADPPKELETARGKLNVEIAEIDLEFRIAIASPLERYGLRLEQAEAALKKRGDLDGLLALREEIERFKKQGEVPAAEGWEGPDAVRLAREQFAEAAQRPQQAMERRLAELYRFYLEHLQRLEKKLVMAGQLEAALLVRKEVEEVRQKLSSLPDPSGEEPGGEPEPDPGEGVRGHFYIGERDEEFHLFLNGAEVEIDRQASRFRFRSVLTTVKDGDIVVIRARSKWVFRALRVAFVDEARQVVHEFDRSDIRLADDDFKDLDKRRFQRLKGRPGGGRIKPGGNHIKNWKRLGFSEDVSQWFFGPAKGVWYHFAFTIDRRHFKPFTGDDEE